MKTLLIKFLLFILLSIFFSPCLPAMENEVYNRTTLPLIKYFLPKEYSGGMQNWTIVQDKRGIMYFGNGAGVLEYDGASWRLIPVPNKGARSLFIDEEGTIFVGGSNEFGYLKPDSCGSLQYVSLNKIISKQKLDIDDVWSILVSGNKLYFQTFSTLFILEAKNDKKGSFVDRLTINPLVTKWETTTHFNRLFLFNSRIFIQERKIGLCEIVNHKLIRILDDDIIKEDLICVMLPYPSNGYQTGSSPNNCLLGFVSHGLYLFDGKKYEKFNCEADDYLIQHRLYWDGAIFEDGSYALGTQSGGIVLIDKNGKLKRIINKNNGFNNKAVWDLYIDNTGTLWASQNHSIVKISYPVSLQIWDDKSGSDRDIYSIKYYDGKVYAAASSGIYYIINSPDSSGRKLVSPIKGFDAPSWDLLTYGKNLLAATNNGVVKIKNNTISPINGTSKFAICLYVSKYDSSIIYVGLLNGVEILKYEGNRFKYIGRLPNFSTGIKNICEDEFGTLWLNTYLSFKIIGLKIPPDRSNINGYNYLVGANASSLKNDTKLFSYKNKLFYYDHKTIFSYDYTKNKFIPEKIFAKIFTDTSYSFKYIYCDKQDVLWCIISKNGITEIQKITIENNQLSVIRYPFLQIIGNEYSFSSFSLVCCTQPEKDPTLWIGVGKTLLNYDIDSKSDIDNSLIYPALVRRAYTNDNKNIFYGFNSGTENNDKKPSAIYYSNSLIGFEFALPDYRNVDENEFQYFLYGFDEGWSNWTKDKKKEYTNLSAGRYYFKVRGRNAFGVISGMTVFEFDVFLPWYLTWQAKLAALLFTLFIISYLVKIRTRYLKDKNVMLERLVDERTARINEQKLTLETQAEKLIELDRAKSEFFTNISHEFRTPLTLIKGQLENLLEIEHDEEIKNKINIAYSNSKRLHALINQILDLSKLYKGKTYLDIERTDIVSLILGRVASFEILAKEKGIDLKTNISINSFLAIIDKEKFERIIDNLLSNAFKFTSSGGTVLVSIQKRNDDSTENVVISVSDTGIGIPENKLPRIFERYYQVQDSVQRKFEGSGLGLAIVKELVELHNGSIAVESKVGEGTRFSITLQGEIVEVLQNTEDSFVQLHPEESEDYKELVLIVEDNSDVRNYIKENLKAFYSVHEAVDGEEGIQKAIEYIPDLIISDLMMPKVDGYRLCEKLKKDQRTRHIPIIILTALEDEKSKLEGLKSGADVYLSKPFSSKELILRVGNILNTRKLLREKYRRISVLKPEDIRVLNIDKEFIESVFEIINKQIENNKFDVQSLADELGMSISQLNRKLNVIISKSAGKLIRTTRLEYAAKLLESGLINISEIAFKIGFSNMPAFSNSFKLQYGMTPSEYQKKNKK